MTADVPCTTQAVHGILYVIVSLTETGLNLEGFAEWMLYIRLAALPTEIKSNDRKGERMKEKWNTFKESLTDITTMTKREFLLTIAVCVLGGMVLGIFLTPKKSVVIGSNNGNNSGNGHGLKGIEDAEEDHAEVEPEEEQK